MKDKICHNCFWYNLANGKCEAMNKRMNCDESCKYFEEYTEDDLSMWWE